MRKKISILILLVATLVVVSGCGKTSPANQPDVKNTSTVGFNQVTSTGQNVKIPDEIKPATTTTVATSTNVGTTTVKINQSDWKIYQNKEFGFQVKYPTEWYFYEFTNKATVFIGKKPFNTSDIQSPPLISISVQNKASYKKYIRYKKNGDVTIDNHPAEKGSYFSDMLDQDIYTFTIEKDNNIFTIDSQVDDAIFSSLVDSFKFTDSLDVKKWSKYRNDKYKFELKFPEFWNVEYENKLKTQSQIGTNENPQSVLINVNDCSYSSKFKSGSLASISAGEGGCSVSVYTIVKLDSDKCVQINLNNPPVKIDEMKCLGIFEKIEKLRLVNHMSAQSTQLNANEVPEEAKQAYELLKKIIDTFKHD